ncbi:CD74 molecule, major histocompatibility complex, class II invariant chain b [Salvelinus fontinalis]|uniref:CD74 molecule, major histocompatibility complex, class II invariant chain b n=1 Tax=Salvelinus fontinalis TaxID=8038 RepID=UPI0024862999|nr:CD74 molecule, major histocompatibility complex, class II invariant chain b [Salvelinus fontinalis]
MSEPERQPLVGASSEQTAINVGTTAEGSNKRAFKIAGFTLLACLLIAGQALTAYFVLGQKNDLKDLQEESKSLKKELSQGHAAAVPMKLHVPMNTMPLLIDGSADEGTSTQGPKEGSGSPTQCQLESTGLKPASIESFRPQCDEQGNYLLQQCLDATPLCWCVDASGKQLSGTLTSGPARCGATSALNHVMAIPDVMLSDE